MTMTDKYRNTPKGRIAPNGYRLCDPLPEGQILIDNEKKQWVIGKPIGLGGFGEIYLIHPKDTPNNQYVMKLDNINGPLFVEVNFVLRACQKAQIESFMAKKNLTFLGVPRFIASGTHNSAYRFLIMERLGDELQNVLEKRLLSIPTICRIACRIIDVLEYIHDQGYIHADIKAQNILRTYTSVDDNCNNNPLNTNNGNNKRKTRKRATAGENNESNQNVSTNIHEDDKYYLIDYGLVERFTFQGAHKPYEPDKRKANNGTCEFRSRDAHIGVISRRSDIESLGYNLILWFYGRHPWGNLLKDAEKVLEKKNWAMANITEFLKESFSGKTFDDDDSANDSTKQSNKMKANSKKSSSINTNVQQQQQSKQSKNNMPISTMIPKGFKKFFDEINSLSHDDRPNYDKYKNILTEIAKSNPKSTHQPSSIDDSVKRPRKNALKSNNDDQTNNRKYPQQTNGTATLSAVENNDNTSGDDTEIEDDESNKDVLSTPSKKRGKQMKSKTPQSVATTPRTAMKKLRSHKLNNLFDDIDNNDAILSKNPPSIATPFNDGMLDEKNSRRFSTKLVSIHINDNDNDDQPLFGPFEREELLAYLIDDDDQPTPTTHKSKSIQTMTNGKLRTIRSKQSSIINDENKSKKKKNITKCRIYINNQRCRTRQSYDDDHDDDDDLKQSNVNMSIKENNHSNSIINSRKTSKSTISLSTSSSSSSTSAVTTTTKTLSSSSTSKQQKNSCKQIARSKQLPLTPAINADGVTETAEMQRVRMLLQNKKKK